MKQILHKPKTGKLIKWAIELSEFDIRYKPRTAVKGKILGDFIMEFTPSNTSTQPIETTQLTPDLPIWMLSVDGDANSQGSGASMILTSLDGIDVDTHSDSDFKPPITRRSMKLS